MSLTALDQQVETSCGTLVINHCSNILLGHVPDRDYWEIPKGRRNPGESPAHAARRELQEETGLELHIAFFEEIGDFDYRQGKRLHLFKVYVADTLTNLGLLQCTTYFPSKQHAPSTLAMDAYCWASREDIPRLCLPRMANTLLSLQW